MTRHATHIAKPATVSTVMLKVLAALLPGIALSVYYNGIGVLLQLGLATITAIAAEAAMLRLRGVALAPFLKDLSAVVTAWLLALAMPPLGAWWLIVVATLFAIVVAKHLYGGLGQNPFNPAMVAFAVCIVSFPALMSQWPSQGLQLPLADQAAVIFGLMPRVDALSSATPLDALKTALRPGAESGTNIQDLLSNQTLFGYFAGHGWEWVAGAYLLGGLWLWQRRIITWHVPVAFMAGLGGLAGALWLYQPQQFASPLFHLFSGGAMLGAFFIATDPVSGCTTPRGKLIFGASAGVLAYVIRVFGGYPDGVAFAVLILNVCAPVIDLFTQPPIFGMKDKS